MNIELNEKEIATILAALRLFQTEAMKMNMAQAFPDHFADISPLSVEEIDYLCGCINESINVYHNSPEFRWQQLMEGTVIEDNTPLNRLILQLAYAVEDENLTADNAFDVLGGNRWWILDIDRDDIREAALTAFYEREDMRINPGTLPLSYKFCVESYKSVAYITREFVHNDCHLHSTVLSNEDYDRIIAEVQELAQQGNFAHTGIYWVANRLACEGTIHPQLQ